MEVTTRDRLCPFVKIPTGFMAAGVNPAVALAKLLVLFREGGSQEQLNQLTPRAVGGTAHCHPVGLAGCTPQLGTPLGADPDTKDRFS
jgi:hypothetical protein